MVIIPVKRKKKKKKERKQNIVWKDRGSQSLRCPPRSEG